MESRKDSLFEDGTIACSLGLKEGQMNQISTDLKKSHRLLQRFQREDYDFLQFAFHDLMNFRLRMSGMGSMAYKRLIFRSWKSHVEDLKIRKLHSDVGANHLTCPNAPWDWNIYLHLP